MLIAGLIIKNLVMWRCAYLGQFFIKMGELFSTYLPSFRPAMASHGMQFFVCLFYVHIVTKVVMIYSL